MDSELEMQRRGYIRMKSMIQVFDPLLAGFWWTNAKGIERWASIKYERLSDYCFGCGCLGHTSQLCDREIVRSELNNSLPMYGPWLSCARQRRQLGWTQIVGGNSNSIRPRDPARKTWSEMMREAGSQQPQTYGQSHPMMKVEQVVTEVVGNLRSK